MSRPLDHDHFAHLQAALSSVDHSWPSLERNSQEIVLFGSRAVGEGGTHSDWDILCVGSGRTRRTRRIDLLWVEPDDLSSGKWLSSEIASHIARYGRWLVGQPQWTRNVIINDDTLAAKRRWLKLKLSVWERSWTLCSPRLRWRYAHAVRRNLQRYDLLAHGHPVPPSPTLDIGWKLNDRDEKTLNLLARQSGAYSAFWVQEILPIVKRRM